LIAKIPISKTEPMKEAEVPKAARIPTIASWSYVCTPLQLWIEKNEDFINPSWCHFEHAPLRDGQLPQDIVKKISKKPRLRASAISRDMIGAFKEAEFDTATVTIFGIENENTIKSIRDTILETRYAKKITVLPSEEEPQISEEALRLQRTIEAGLKEKLGNVIPLQSDIPQFGELAEFDFGTFAQTTQRFQQLGLQDQIMGALLSVQQNCIDIPISYVKAISSNVFQILDLSQIEGGEDDYLPTLFLNTRFHDLTLEEIDFFQHLHLNNDEANYSYYPDFLSIQNPTPVQRIGSIIDRNSRPTLAQAEVLRVLFDVLIEMKEQNDINFPITREFNRLAYSNCRVTIKLIHELTS